MQGRQFYASSTFSSRAHTIVAITFAQKGKNEAGQMMTKTSIVNLVDLAGRYVQRHRINCLPFLKRFISLVDLTQVFPLSIRPQTRSNLSPVVLQLIAVAGTKFFFPRLRAQSNGRSTDNVRGPGWPFVRTTFGLPFILTGLINKPPETKEQDLIFCLLGQYARVYITLLFLTF